MRRHGLVLGLLVACLLWVSPAWAVIARVGTPVGNNVGASSSVSRTYAPTEGNFVAVWVVTLNTAPTAITSVTDDGATGGSVYAAVFNDNYANNTNWQVALFYTLSAKASVTTITANYPSASAGVIIVAEYSGLAAASALDTNSAQASGASGTTQTSDAITPTAGLNELLLGYFFQNTNQDDFTATSPMSLVLNQNESLASGANLGATDQLVTSTTGNYTAGTTTAGAVNWDAYIAAFKAAAAPTAIRRRSKGPF